jgi:serine/threonine-protein kinase
MIPDNDRSPFDQNKKPAVNLRQIGQFVTRPWFLALVLFGVLGVVGFLSVDSIMKGVLHSRPEVVVPNLEGKRLNEALTIVSDLDLSLKQDGTQFDESLPAGTVVRQHPPSGMTVRAGRPIHVVVSKGGQGAVVPDVTGKLLVEAQSGLGAEGLQVGAVTELYSADKPKGQTLGQSPAVGALVTRGALVDVVISKGPPPAGVPLVPGFIGRPAAEAEAWAQSVNAPLKTNEDKTAQGAPGTISAQKPVAGQPVMPGDTVEITVIPGQVAPESNFLRFDVPAGTGDVAVRATVRDNDGERQIYRESQPAGTTINIPLSVKSTSRVRIYVDDVLKEERVVEPPAAQ